MKSQNLQYKRTSVWAKQPDETDVNAALGSRTSYDAVTISVDTSTIIGFIVYYNSPLAMFEVVDDGSEYHYTTINSVTVTPYRPAFITKQHQTDSIGGLGICIDSTWWDSRVNIYFSGSKNYVGPAGGSDKILYIDVIS